MKTTHTPGPWTVGRTLTDPGPDYVDTLIHGGGYGIARILAGDAILNGPNSNSNLAGDYAEAVAEREANARLIAAAPELLDALDKAERELSHWNQWATTTRPGYEKSEGWKLTCKAINTARAAIAKATEANP